MSQRGPVAVTGAAGLLGRAVVAELLAAGEPVIGLDRLPSGPGSENYRSMQLDLMAHADVERAIAGCRAVVHLAALPTPQSGTASEVWRINTTTTGHVLAAANSAGITRVVLASSQSALGLPYARHVMTPRYLPVDEDHPAIPSDPYSASKLACEILAQSFGRSGALDILCLRFPVIWDAADHAGSVARRVGNPGQGARSLWAYVDARDAARAVRLAVQSAIGGCEVVNVTSARAFASEPTADLVRQWFPDLTDVRHPLDGDAAAFDWRKAERLLGFKARYAWTVEGVADLGASG